MASIAGQPASLGEERRFEDEIRTIAIVPIFPACDAFRPFGDRDALLPNRFRIRHDRVSYRHTNRGERPPVSFDAGLSFVLSCGGSASPSSSDSIRYPQDSSRGRLPVRIHRRFEVRTESFHSPYQNDRLETIVGTTAAAGISCRSLPLRTALRDRPR